MEGKLEWGNQHGAVNVGFAHSQFDNHIQELVWDSPYRVTDTTSSTAYTTGNGTTQGRLSLPPSNTEDTFSGTAVGRLAHRTTVAANFAVATLKQNGTIIPFTINTAIPTIPMDRTTAEAKVNVASFGLVATSRPAANLWLNARYRYFNHDNKTPVFNGEEYVRLDQVMEETGGETDQLNITQNQLNLGMAYTALPFTSFKVDYGRNAIDRTFREFATTTENSIKFSVDSVGSALVTLRSSYEYAKRTGSGFDEAILIDAGQQPEMRHYDVANRNRNRGTIMFTATPTEKADVTFSVAAGKDTYPDQEFGLLNNKNQAYTVGFDVFPNDLVTLSVVYGYEKYTNLAASRAASPGATFVDPSYDWNDDTEEKLNTFSASLDSHQGDPEDRHPVRLRLQQVGRELQVQRTADRPAVGRRAVRPAPGQHEQAQPRHPGPPLLRHVPDRVEPGVLVRQVPGGRLRDARARGRREPAPARIRRVRCCSATSPVPTRRTPGSSACSCSSRPTAPAGAGRPGPSPPDARPPAGFIGPLGRARSRGCSFRPSFRPAPRDCRTSDQARPAGVPSSTEFRQFSTSSMAAPDVLGWSMFVFSTPHQ